MHGSARVLTGSPFDDASHYHLTVWPVEPAVLRPLTIGGIGVGLLAGWLLVAALARRRFDRGTAPAGGSGRVAAAAGVTTS